MGSPENKAIDYRVITIIVGLPVVTISILLFLSQVALRSPKVETKKDETEERTELSAIEEV